MPSSRSAAADAPRRPDWLTARPFAHRGLHGAGRIENSRAAFRAAITAGQGIELDVQASACGSAFVFHDRALDRLCVATGTLAALVAEEASKVVLRNSDETLPRLEEVLALVKGRVPLLIEVKQSGERDVALCLAVESALRGYRGPAAVMSFDPRIVRWFARRAPQRIRGLVVSEEGKKNLKGWLARHLALRLGRPDFLAYDVRSLPSAFAARARANGRAVLAWTVRSPRDAEVAARHADQIIHELPLPA